MNFEEQLLQFYKEFGKGKKMVLSTSKEDKVYSRMMSVVCIEGDFYFQTDRNFRKYHQIKDNPNVALCIDHIQIEGVCEELGQPLKNDAFCEVFKETFRGSYDMYTALENERFFVVKPTFIERWVYKDTVPFIETFDFVNKTYRLEEYKMK